MRSFSVKVPGGHFRKSDSERSIDFHAMRVKSGDKEGMFQ